MKMPTAKPSQAESFFAAFSNATFTAGIKTTRSAAVSSLVQKIVADWLKVKGYLK